MITDRLSRWSNYGSLNERFAAAFQFIEQLTPDTPEGRTEIDGSTIFCMVEEYETRPWEGQRFEAHREYADIQILLSGEESILWAPVETLTVLQPYEPDIEFYEFLPSSTKLVLTPGIFCVFFPHDAHAPCLQHTVPSTVRKAVVKVRIS
ncbi:MAG: YhcH/YjgK/YiaL family protein [Candidatus Hydrogenedentes bacterium]|nr:YhcH/YjgK/YiaL family protein [Candidatus Hydrogenedentota bacterium]